LPTITHKPCWGSPAGYDEEEQLFAGEQITALAAILGHPAADLVVPIKDAAAKIWRFEYSRGVSLGEQKAALAKLAGAADFLLAKLTGHPTLALDPQSRRKILLAYAAGQNTKKARAGALGKYKRDLAALSRLYENVAVAAKDQLKRGAPKKSLERFAALRLIEVSEHVTHSNFVNTKRQGRNSARRFVVSALSMLGIDQAAAEGAIQHVMDQRKAAHEQRKNYPSEMGTKSAK
jgi:hypothetical protein